MSVKSRYPKKNVDGRIEMKKKNCYITERGSFSLLYGMKGIPCSVPDRCAAAEEIEDGVTGFVFKTGDIHSLKQAIMKYEKADILTLQKNILSTFNADDYTPNTHTRNLLNIYSEILNN